MSLRLFACVILLFVAQAARAEVPVEAGAKETTLGKGELAAASKAIQAMQRRGWSLKGKQMIISDEGKEFRVAIMNDPIDLQLLGSQGGVTWFVKKEGLALRGPIFDR